MLAVTTRSVSGQPESSNVSPNTSIRRSATSPSPVAGDTSSAIITNSSPPRRPRASVPRTTLSSPCGDRLEQFVANTVAERVVDGLEVVDVHEQYSDWRAVARANQHLLCAVNHQRSVWKPRQWVMGRHELKLPLAGGRAPRQFARVPAPEDLAQAYEGDVEGQLHHRMRVREHLRRGLLLGRDIAQHVIHSFAPAQTPLGQVIQWHDGVIRGQLAEHLPTFPADLNGGLGIASHHPQGYRSRGDRADLFQTVLDQTGAADRPRVPPARDDLGEHIRAFLRSAPRRERGVPARRAQTERAAMLALLSHDSRLWVPRSSQSSSTTASVPLSMLPSCQRMMLPSASANAGMPLRLRSRSSEICREWRCPAWRAFVIETAHLNGADTRSKSLRSGRMRSLTTINQRCRSSSNSRAWRATTGMLARPDKAGVRSAGGWARSVQVVRARARALAMNFCSIWPRSRATIWPLRSMMKLSGSWSVP